MFQKIPIKCTVRKLPILIEPSFSKRIDFGSLFVSKTPYFLEYSVTNGGKSSYIVFIGKKHSKGKIESRFVVEPNRFELAPDMSRSVKFYLNSEVPVNVDEEFIIEGCSTNFPMREMIREATLQASLIRPILGVSKSDLIFNCCYDDVGSQPSKIGDIRIIKRLISPLSRADHHHQQVGSADASDAQS